MYLSLPVPYCEPARLLALAVLYGFEPASAETANILELGCSSGGNIIPLAVRYPNAHFVGVDIDAAAIDMAQAKIQALGLANISLVVADIAGFAPPGDPFDLILCHGVYSWTPAPVRAAILEICGSCLSHNGLAVISFNVLPGWRAQQIVRDLCMSQSGLETPDHLRVAKARAILANAAAKLSDATPYGLAVRQAARRLETRPDSYLLGEFLAPTNDAFFFDAFAASAAAHGLNYVCDGEFTLPSTEVSEATADVLTGRPFRRAVLARGKARFDAINAQNLHARCALRRAESGGGYVTGRGHGVQFRDDGVASAIERLIDAYPTTLRISDLSATAPQANVRNAVIGLANARQAELRTLPLATGNAHDARPRAFSLAQVEAASGAKWVSTLAHRAAPIGPETALLLRIMDGSRDRDALRHAFAAHAHEGTLSFEVALQAIEREALLEPGPSGAA